MSTASGNASGGMLERMVQEAIGDVQAPVEEMDLVGHGASEESDGGVALQGEDEDMASQSQNAYEGKGKGKLAALSANEEDDSIQDKPFRLFDLPTEIRLEIYRACLTRPYKILLSKVEKPVLSRAEEEEQEEEAAKEFEEEFEVRRAVGESRRTAWYHTETGKRQAQLSARRRAGSHGPARPTLRASSSSSARSRSSTSARQPLAANAPPTSTQTPAQSSNGATFSLSASVVKKARAAPDTDDKRPKMEDPLLVTILRASKDVYKEARDVLYSENVFSLDIFTAVNSLAALHQRSRRRIKHVELSIPTYTEILESFSETVRLSLRYCFGLRKLVINTPFTLPGGEGNGNASASPNTTVYANGFDILRWLPQGCEVLLEGTKNREIDIVVGRHMRLAGVQDKVSWEQAQFIHSRDDSVVRISG